jgi:hypothetical protein
MFYGIERVSVSCALTDIDPMNPKYHIPLVLLNIPFLLLSPAAHAQDQNTENSATEVSETEKAEAEKAKVLLDKEAAERTRAAEKPTEPFAPNPGARGSVV